MRLEQQTAKEDNSSSELEMVEYSQEQIIATILKNES